MKLCKASLRYLKSPTVICAASFDMVLTPSLCIPQRAGSNLHVMSGPKRRLTSWVAPLKSSRLLSSNTSPKEPYRDPPHSAKDQMMLGQETTRVRSLTIQDLWYKWIVLAGFGSINTEICVDDLSHSSKDHSSGVSGGHGCWALLWALYFGHLTC